MSRSCCATHHVLPLQGQTRWGFSPSSNAWYTFRRKVKVTDDASFAYPVSTNPTNSKKYSAIRVDW